MAFNDIYPECVCVWDADLPLTHYAVAPKHLALIAALARSVDSGPCGHMPVPLSPTQKVTARSTIHKEQVTNTGFPK